MTRRQRRRNDAVKRAASFHTWKNKQRELAELEARIVAARLEGTLGTHQYGDLLGHVFTSVVKGSALDNDAVVFTRRDGRRFAFVHQQDCCESVYIEDISGDLSDLEGAAILMAEESSNCESSEGDSNTWTFYKFATRKGYVDVRFHGSSNGYYSEGVSFIALDPVANV